MEHRPGTRIPISGQGLEDDDPYVMKIEIAAWVLAGQLTDEKIHLIQEVLNKEPETDYKRNVQKNYCLQDHRAYNG